MDCYDLRVKGQKKAFQANGTKKQAGKVILVSDKIDFKPILIKRDSDGHYKLIKGKIHKENNIILNIYALNRKKPNIIKTTANIAISKGTC